MAANLVKLDLSFHAHDNPLSRGLSEESLYFSTINNFFLRLLLDCKILPAVTLGRHL